MSEQISFIFHGPYKEEHLEMINECRKYGEIILSTDKKYINEVAKNICLYDKICLYDFEDIGEIYNFQNMYKHACSVLQGLKLSNNRNCIKIRTSHSFSNLEYVINKIIENHNDKYICDNFTINPTMPYHLADTIVAGKRETMTGIYQTLIDSLTNKDFIYQGIDIRIRAEVAFFCSYLKYKKIPIQNEDLVWFVDVDGKKYWFPVNNHTYINFIDSVADIIDIKEITPCNIKYTNVQINPDYTYRSLKDVIPLWINK